ncbi:MAG TPA: hypothetical protein VG944_04695, partial [Fimbriimonas sp.]|nr:hypothetical protein [Fimbriimonas sp.]
MSLFAVTQFRGHKVAERDRDRMGREVGEEEGNGPDLDNPIEAYKWRELAMRDENGQIAPGSLQRAIAQKRAMEAQIHPDLTGDSWVELGPTNVSGRCRALITDPTNSSLLFMGAAGGGVWKSTDAGATWTSVADTLKSMAVNCLTMDPANHNVIYAGTGEGYFNGDSIQGFGIYKSTDNGKTWSQLANTANFGCVNRIAVDPTNSNNVLATIQYGGIARSTDGGSTWSNPHFAQLGASLQFCAASPTKVLATVFDYDFGTGQWFFSVLTSTDSGASWNPASTGLGKVIAGSTGIGRIEATWQPGSSTVILASVQDGRSGPQSATVWKSTNSGVDFAQISGAGVTDANWYANDIWI